MTTQRRTGKVRDRRQVHVEFEGESLAAHEGEPLAAALLASGVDVFSRSIKYHRARGPTCLSGRCGSCLMRVDGEPNVYTCLTPVEEGMRVERQNAFPSAEVDVFRAVDWLYAKGLDHHGLFAGVPLVEHAVARVAREMAGLGTLPDPDRPPPPVHVTTREAAVLVVGAGPAGLAAAVAATRAGAQTLLVDEQAQPGGHLLSGLSIPAAEVVAPRLAAFDAAGGERLRAFALAAFRDVGGRLVIPLRAGRGELTLVHARRMVVATGAYAPPPSFGNNDLPGVFSARALGRLVLTDGVLPGRTALVDGTGDEAVALAAVLRGAGCEVVGLVGETPPSAGPFVQGRIVRARGRARVAGAVVEGPSGELRIRCDLIACTTTPAPLLDLARQAGVPARWSPQSGVFEVIANTDGSTSAPDVFACGDVTGPLGRTRRSRLGRDGRRRRGEEPRAVTKTFVCACEDVTAADVDHAIAAGYRDIESVKRYTGFGTGVCQGKSCLTLVARRLAEAGAPQAGLLPFTPRPPGRLVALGELSAFPDDALGPVPPPGVPSPALPFEHEAPHGEPVAGPHPLRPAEPLPARASVVIVGGGIMGLALAWNLARRGLTDVLVLERGYLLHGASGRNGGGVRMQWSTPTNVRLARRSIELCRSFAREFGINIWLRQGGYLFLAPDEEQAARLEKNARLHNELGVPTRILGPGGAREIVPELDGGRFVAAAFNPDDGVVFPWPFLWGYEKGARSLGARVETFTQVTGIETAGGRVNAVRTDRGEVRCDLLVNAAGAWSPGVAGLAGVHLPNEPHRHEICSTEPLKPWLGPLVSVLGNGLYFSQSMRGEIVGGMGDPDEPPGLEMGSTLRFLSRYGRELVRCVPALRDVKVIRQWAGCYDVTPDNQPVLGETPGLPNFLQMSGFVGHGFMMAPAVAEAMALWMTGGEKDPIFDRFTLARFAAGSAVEREDFIIG